MAVVTAGTVKKALRRKASKKRAKTLAWFFKTEKGQYGYGDRFIGVVVPDARKVARAFEELPFGEVKKLLRSPDHEDRLTALLILVERSKKGDSALKKKIFDFYCRHFRHVNNWDLVDLSAPYIVGPCLNRKNERILDRWASSKNLWIRRISIISTFWDIRHHRFSRTLRISRKLLNDQEDLIHKAVGWMLREVGKKDLNVEEKFLKKMYQKMPRTMLRYAIERFPEKRRQAYLKGRI